MRIKLQTTIRFAQYCELMNSLKNWAVQSDICNKMWKDIGYTFSWQFHDKL